jgi:hypothetical protein
MAEFKISRIRYTWRDSWETATQYIKDDIVRYGGQTWVCFRGHTASTFAEDQLYLANPDDTDPTPAWRKMTDGQAFVGDWNDGTLYNPGDVTSYGGNLYICTESHTSDTVFATNSAKWTAYAAGVNWLEEWQPNTRYGVNDLIKYNGIIYTCAEEHTSGTLDAGLESVQSKWSIFYSNVEYVGEWTSGTRYRPNDLVKYGGSILRCYTGHTAGASITASSFSTELPGYKFQGDWYFETHYAVGDVVRHGGYLYKSLTNNIGVSPETVVYGGATDWIYISKGVNFQGAWAPTNTYRTGDVVRRGGNLYIALSDTFSDGSSLDYLDAEKWELLVTGSTWKNGWIVGAEYAPGDVVNYRGSVWQANYEHVSSIQNFPSDDNGSGNWYWDLVSSTGHDAGLVNRGDLLTFDYYRGFIGDESSVGVTNVGIDDEDKFLSVDGNGSVYYKVWGNAEKVVYVSCDETIALDDITDPDRGYNPFKPWRTIKFACDRLEELGQTIASRHTIHVKTGYYRETLPIIVPANVAIVGDELRGVHVLPALAVPALQNDLDYSKAALTRISTILGDILSGRTIEPSDGNTVPQHNLFETVTSEHVSGVGNDSQVIDIVTTTTFIQVSAEAISSIRSLITDIKNYSTYYIAGGGTLPTVSGTNTAIDPTSQAGLGFANAAKALNLLKDFIAAEASAYTAQEFPDYEFNAERCQRDMKRFVEAWIYDVTYTGNYKSLLAARWYVAAVNGSETSDMFWLRNATGLRNMTLEGLWGTLSPPAVNELYRRPTGGAFAALDPGWGPDDERVWITSRSPYIQNCTTFGNNCIGQRVDGSVHNGGNKSFVSNDFTQIISDGIGAWVSNNGRVELVSVFTYYAQIGMFAERGGIIRSTNGNSSYGDFGALADGNDPTETPRYAFVNNRTNQAVVAAALAGEINDYILILEFANAGQDYTNASYTIVGSGTGATTTQEEFRDNAVFEMQVKNAPGNEGAIAGGGSYTLIGNNAQAGDETSITIASNTESTEEELLGLRIVITSGDGTGQYGYVTAYNDMTKVVSVARESDDQPGWDHVIPGTPSVQSMTTNATYKFEPRITFDEPGFTSEGMDMGIGGYWADMAYGETYATFSNVAGTLGTGTTIDVVPFDATFNVIKNGRSYEVTLVQGGAGYAVGDTVHILGSEIGGIDEENDVIITVLSVSDDSTNSIMTFGADGIAQSGVFVATPGAEALTNKVIYSSDGVDWTEASLPYSGHWSIAAGDTYFVAVKENSGESAWSRDGATWTRVILPLYSGWSSICYGNGMFLAVSNTLNSAAYSKDGGLTWSSTTLPNAPDSTTGQWVDVAYGKETFVVLANNNNSVAVGTYNSISDSWTWTTQIMDVINDSTQKNWTSIAYGNGRWVAISDTGEGAWSFDGTTWYPGGAANHILPEFDDSTEHNWQRIRYGQGVFLAVGNTGGRVVGDDPTTGPSVNVGTSYDGIVWQYRETAIEGSWRAIAFGNPDISLGDSTHTNNTPMWVVAPDDGTTLGVTVRTGARALGRAVVEAGRIRQVKIWEPGSGYTTPPSYTITDPNHTTDAYIEPRIGDGVLGQPTWLQRGSYYKTSSTHVTVNGDGYADIVPVGQFVTLSGLEVLPGPGTQFRFRGETDYFTVATVELDSQQNDGKFTGVFRIGPYLTADYNLEHGSQVEIRERYSQVRITGHDFLDVGSGNFVESNYPEMYTGAAYYFTAPENEVVESSGGRVFYTSTDQDGNFRCGELFAVEQATGIVTISADFFDLQGLTELALGGVRLGGSGAVVREFSTDSKFTADSNNVVPTQRAIKAYLQNRLNVGGSDLLTASFIAGTVLVGPNLIRNTASLTVVVPVMADFSGVGLFGASTHISGSILAQNMFYYSFGLRPQS